MKNKIVKSLIVIMMCLFCIGLFCNQVSAAKVDFKNVDTSAFEDAVDDTEEDVLASRATIIGSFFTIFQVAIVLVAAIWFVVVLIKLLSCPKKDKEKREKIEYHFKICIVGCIVVFASSGILGIVKSFKPIIYLYPEEDTNLTIKFKYSEKLYVSYPKYVDGWNIFATKDGTITDLNTGRNLYALYYENYNLKNFKVEKDGFIVKGEDVTTFLEEKLAVLGLNERESEEFIIYWLPTLEKNKYNYIRFASKEEIDENAPIEFSKEPDTFIRVLMTYKKVLIPFEVEEQKLETPERTGFVAVEWGGTEIK